MARGPWPVARGTWHVARGVGSETVSGIASESKLGVGSEVPTKKADSSVSPLSGD